ncbi:MAG: Inner membrane protein YrbG [Alphaproteobacteria bacterium MarineAlpha9_Bin1]|nr:MAG: Inner membrane protein YrbG [Alphaproteobacteria bacterium MarineAlpha9_Bin1]
MELYYIQIIIGVSFLAIAGNYLVKGTVNTANFLGVSPYIISSTIVAFCTSAPELFVSVFSSLNKAADAGLGNIMGSNFANVFLALGAAAIILPVRSDGLYLKRDVIFLLAITLLFTVLLLSGIFWKNHTAILFILLLAAYLVYSFRYGKKHPEEVLKSPEIKPYKSLFQMSIGIIGVMLGSILLVAGAKSMAIDFSISATIIGLSILALGTSLPEVVISLIASIKKEYNVAIGNIVGSNIFNVLGIGAATVIADIYDSGGRSGSGYSLTETYPLIVAAVFLLLFSLMKWNYKRPVGIIFVLTYFCWFIALYA